MQTTHFIFQTQRVANVIPIVDDSGAPVLFDFTETWADGSFKSVSHAVEKQNNGTYKIAIKGTEINQEGDNEAAYANWQTFTISDTGILDRSSGTWSASIQKFEPDFAQDLDGDGNIGISTTGLISISTDTTGETLKKNSGGELFIILQNGNNITIQDTSGFLPVFDKTETLEDGTKVVVETYAVESFTKDNSTYYKLITRIKETLNDTTKTAFETFTINDSGELDWTTFAYSERSTAWEKLFNQDLDGNGSIDSIGSNSNVADVNTDSTGARLQIDENDVLYIKNSGSRISITDSTGGTPTFSETEIFGSGS